MADEKKLVIKILKIELEETRSDIALMVDIYRQRYDSQEITHYVQQENKALLEREIHCLESLIPVLEAFDSDPYKDKESFIRALKAYLGKAIEEKQFPRAVFLLAERKLDKVLKYIY